jgi:hypothetical protein
VQGCWQALALVHVKHCERPDTLANVPRPQQPHTLLLLAPTTELARPARQSWQDNTETEPVSGLKEPAGHSEHLAWPTTGLKEPGAQGEHRDEPITEWKPAGHTVNMSTVLKLTSATSAQCISNQQQRQQYISPLQHIFTLPSDHPLQSLTSTNTTHPRRRRISRVRHSAAMWLQDKIERRSGQQWTTHRSSH